MSFDAHSLERLRQLGRQLPQPLPVPEARPPVTPRATEQRHRVEVETDPEELFRELMQVSPDGTVPPHLMARLRDLEARRAPSTTGSGAEPAGGAPAAAGPGAPAQRRSGPGRSTVPRADPRLASEHADLYTAFNSLLLEDEDDA
jgi:hypothetical protein